MFRDAWKWLTHVETVQREEPLDQNRQNHFDRSFEFKEAERRLVISLLIGAAAVMLGSKNACMVRAAATAGLLCFLESVLQIWDQHLIDKHVDMRKPAIATHITTYILPTLRAFLVALGAVLLAFILWNGAI